MSITINSTQPVITLTPEEGPSVTVSPQGAPTITISSTGAQGTPGADGVGADPTQEELLIIQQSTVKTSYSVTETHPTGERKTCTYIDANGYTNHTLSWGINGSGQYTTWRRQFDFGGETWVFEQENLWSGNDHIGTQINLFSRT